MLMLARGYCVPSDDDKADKIIIYHRFDGWLTEKFGKTTKAYILLYTN